MSNQIGLSAMILCAGKSSRLKDFTNKTKILIPLYKEKNSIDYNMQLLKNINLDKIYINLHKDAKQVKTYIKNYNLNNVEFSFEKKLLGTAGAVKKINTNKKIKTLIIIYGDTISKLKLKSVIKFHYKQNSNFTIVSNKSYKTLNSGVLEINSKKILQNLYEKKIKQTNKSRWVNSGIYIIEKKILNKIDKSHYDFSNNFIPDLLKKNIKIYVYKSRARFLTIDSKKLLFKSRKALESKKIN